ncbi:MAG: hypothetical protein ALAOOOJD_04705 [bacterium]|nr:hypothetical protein [bacterium]
MAFELRRRAAIIKIQIGGIRHIDFARLGNRLTVVDGFKFCHLLEAVEQPLAHFPNHPAALRGVHFPPRAVERRACRLDGTLNIFDAAFGNLCNDFGGGRVDRREGFTARGVFPFAIDEKLSLHSLSKK